MMWLPWIVGALVLPAIGLIAFMWWKLSARRLSGAKRARLQKQWDIVRDIHNPMLRVLEAEKILDQAFALVGYRGSFGEKLQKAGPRFPFEQDLWNAHKLRNRIAHESGMAVSEADAARALAAFERALRAL